MYAASAKQTIIDIYKRPLAAGLRHRATPNILQRLQKRDAAAISDCLRTYGDKIWGFSLKATDSNRQAEILAGEIFQDIWLYATDDINNLSHDEELIIEYIATRRTIKHKWEHRR